MGYFMYRYIHLGKEKHPENLIWIYGNELSKRFCIPAEKIVINFITLNILEDSKISHKDTSCVEKSSDMLDMDEAEICGDWEPHPEGVEVKHLGYASHLVDPFCDSKESTNGPSPTQPVPLNRAHLTDKAATLYECDIKTTPSCAQPEGPKLNLTSLEPQILQNPYTLQLRETDLWSQKHTDTEEMPEKEPLTTMVDWDPRSGKLWIPSLPSFHHYAEQCEHPRYTGHTGEGILSRLYQEETPDKPPGEKEVYLRQFMEEWELSVQMDD